jgi:hypothetical protein
MTEDRDPSLQALFAQAEEPHDGAAFTATVMARVDTMRQRRRLALVVLALAAAVLVVLVGPLLMDVAGFTTRGVSTAVIDLEGGVVAQILSPVNNVATVLVLVVAVLFGVYRKVFR